MVLVFGATGQLGLSVCQQLARQGRQVRAAVRPSSSPEQVEALRALGAGFVQADLKDPASLRAACQGMEAVISTATTTLRDQTADSIAEVDHRGGLNLVEAARQAGVGHFVYVSFPASLDDARPSPLSQAKRAVEGELRRGGPPFTLLHPGVFMEVWLSPALGFDFPHARARVLGSGEAQVGWISLHDVARAAVACLDRPDLRGVALPLVTEHRSLREVVALFEEVSGRTFETEHVPVEALEAQRNAATSPLEQSFAALMLTLAHPGPGRSRHARPPAGRAVSFAHDGAGIRAAGGRVASGECARTGGSGASPMIRLLAGIALATLSVPALAAPVQGTLTGRIVDWPGGRAELRIETETGDLLAAGAVDAAGTFRVLLPARIPEATGLPPVSGLFARPSNYGPDCGGEGTATPTTGRYRFFHLVVRRDQERLGDLTLNSSSQLGPLPGAVDAPLMYFDTSTTLQGTVECVDQSLQETLGGTFAAGWHLAPRRVEAVTPEGREHARLTSGALPSGLAWRLYRDYGGVGLMFQPGPKGETVVDIVRPDLPAAHAGLQPGDVLVSLDGRSLEGVPFAQVVSRLRGAAGTAFTLGVRRSGRSAPLVFRLVRALIRLP